MTAPAPAERATPRQARSAAKIEAILAAARDLLTDPGVEPAAVTTTAVARRAGLSVASLYRYFADLDAIVAVLLGEHARVVHGVVQEALVGDHLASIDDVYAAVLDAHLALYRERPELTRLWTDPRHAARHAELEAASDAAILDLVAEALRSRRLVARITPTVRRRLVAHWTAAGALIGLLLHGDPAARPAVEGELRAQVAAAAARLLA